MYPPFIARHVQYLNLWKSPPISQFLHKHLLYMQYKKHYRYLLAQKSTWLCFLLLNNILGAFKMAKKPGGVDGIDFSTK